MLFDNTEAIGHPALAADRSDRIVLVWPVYSGHDPQSQHIYSAQRIGDSWSTPMSIVDSPTADAPVLAADVFGELHLLWNTTLAKVQYNDLMVEDWFRPRRVSERVVAASNGHPYLWADALGRLHLVYAEHGTSRVAYRSSADGGASWSAPLQIAPTSLPTRTADYASIAGSEGGTLHVVWSEFERPWDMEPVGVFYARSTDGGATWSPAVLLAGPGANQIDIASGGARTVHVVWNGARGVEGRFHRWSSDGGATWSPVQQIVARGTADGVPQLAVDSAGSLHLVTAYEGEIWHATWDGAQWSEPECVSCSNVEPRQRAADPAAIVADGNVLHVAYSVGHRQLWHTSAQLRSPHLTLPPAQRVGWWSDRFWHRDLKRVPALLAIIASIALVRVLRRSRGALAGLSNAQRGSARP